jgi:SAM-dependent MidA family methyltransferase
MQDRPSDSVSTLLTQHIAREIDAAGGWIGFDRYMALALYAPGLGYYCRSDRQFGCFPSSGSDYVTAPELTPLYGKAVARQVAQALHACGGDEVIEFGAGSGALAAQLFDSLGASLKRYTIVDLSGTLRRRQHERLMAFGERVRWLDTWPEALHGVIVGNEVLDAMPVKLLHWDGTSWFERGVVADEAGDGFAFADRATTLRPALDERFERSLAPGTTIEVHPQSEAFIATLAERIGSGAAFFIDYGFPQAEYYHPQRTGGTLMCHRRHLADSDPLVDVGDKDITAHVNFSAIALAGQDAGLEVLGYTTQARFLMNCGLLDDLRNADLRTLSAAQKLINEHEMGELYKVIGFAKGCSFDAIGFLAGDRTHRL